MNASSRCSWTLRCQLTERSIHGIACGKVNGLNSIVFLQLLPWDLRHRQRWWCLQTQKRSLISTRGENGEIKNCRSFFHGCKGSGCRIPTKSTDLQHSRAGQVVVVKKCENIVKLVTFISERRTIMDKQGKGLKIHVVILTKVPCLSPRIQLMSCSQSGGLARTLSLKMELTRWCNVTQVCSGWDDRPDPVFWLPACQVQPRCCKAEPGLVQRDDGKMAVSNRHEGETWDAETKRNGMKRTTKAS